MDPLETMKAMGELWGRGAQSLFESQRNMMGAMGTAMPSSLSIPDLAATQKAQDAFSQAWRTAQDVAANFTKGMDADRQGGPNRTDPVAADVLSKVFDPRGWLSASNEIDEALNRMAQGPQLADLWTYERTMAALFSAWTALRRRNLEHNAVMLEAWTRATGVFAKAVNARAEAGQPLDSSRALMMLWIETANDVLLETQRSDAFLESQRETLKAATDLRLAQQKAAEFLTDLYGAPSRSEIDDVHRSLTDLRREVRALKRAEQGRRPEQGTAQPLREEAPAKVRKPAVKRPAAKAQQKVQEKAREGAAS